MKTFLLFLIISLTILAQPSNLYMSQPIKRAYEKHTRSFDGSPGENYWLNKAEYKIKASVNPDTKMLDGSLSVRYFNNSPDTLTKIVMHLYPDIFKKGNTRDFELPAEALNDGVFIKSLSVNNNSLDVSDTSHVITHSTTNMNIKLSQPLPPDNSINISVEWNFELPSVRTIRGGFYADTSIFVSYWSPKIAVYDDINGWDELTYTGQSEMYSGIADFDVEITAPKNYIVWGTGEIQNPEEVLTDNLLKKYNEAHNTDEVIHIITAEDLSKDLTIGDFSVWKFKAHSTPDFTFQLGKNYLWDGATVALKNKNVFVDAGYRKDSKNYTEVVRIMESGVKFFSEEMPGVEFPYPTITAFNGSGGMEFPMVLNDGEASTLSSTVGLTLHELAHTYFPFYMGINERRYAFLDEGWAVFAPTQLQRKLGDEFPIERRFVRQEAQLKGVVEVPPMTPSYHLKSPAYRVASYTRSSAALFALQDLLGKEKFFEAMNTFVNGWKEKHPTPYDFFFTFNRVADEDLEWFWKPWYFEFHSADLNLVDYISKDGKKFVRVKNDGGLPLSIKLKVYFTDNTEKTISVSPRVWQSGKDIVEVDLETNKEILEIELGDELVPDINYSKREILSGD